MYFCVYDLYIDTMKYLKGRLMQFRIKTQTHADVLQCAGDGYIYGAQRIWDNTQSFRTLTTD